MNLFEAGCAIVVASAACLLGAWVFRPWLDVLGPASVAVVALAMLALFVQDWWVRFRARRRARDER